MKHDRHEIEEPLRYVSNDTEELRDLQREALANVSAGPVHAIDVFTWQAIFSVLVTPINQSSVFFDNFSH